MEKKIQDYAHLYAPHCSVILNDYNRKFSKWGWCTNTPYHFGLCKLHEFEEEGYTAYQLILRPLSDMTEEEVTHIGVELKAGTWNAEDVKSWANTDLLWTVKHLTPKVLHYLLSKSFDLFGLIESGLAIDATTLEPSKQ